MRRLYLNDERWYLDLFRHCEISKHIALDHFSLGTVGGVKCIVREDSVPEVDFVIARDETNDAFCLGKKGKGSQQG